MLACQMYVHIPVSISSPMKICITFLYCLERPKKQHWRKETVKGLRCTYSVCGYICRLAYYMTRPGHDVVCTLKVYIFWFFFSVRLRFPLVAQVAGHFVFRQRHNHISRCLLNFVAEFIKGRERTRHVLTFLWNYFFPSIIFIPYKHIHVLNIFLDHHLLHCSCWVWIVVIAIVITPSSFIILLLLVISQKGSA